MLWESGSNLPYEVELLGWNRRHLLWHKIEVSANCICNHWGTIEVMSCTKITWPLLWALYSWRRSSEVTSHVSGDCRGRFFISEKINIENWLLTEFIDGHCIKQIRNVDQIWWLVSSCTICRQCWRSKGINPVGCVYSWGLRFMRCGRTGMGFCWQEGGGRSQVVARLDGDCWWHKVAPGCSHGVTAMGSDKGSHVTGHQ